MQSPLALSVLFVLIAATAFAGVGYTSTGRGPTPHPKVSGQGPTGSASALGRRDGGNCRIFPNGTKICGI
jgi:hypothetical protein